MAKSLATESPAGRAGDSVPVQNGKGRKTQVRRSAIHGKGVYALRDFAPGQIICEYLGERISWAEAQRRHEMKDGDSFHTFYFQTEQGDVIDGGSGGNSARWINHSCEPNCEAQEDEDGRIFVVALLPITAGDELCYDYALEIDARITESLKRAYRCACGAPDCRGTMLKTRRKAAPGGAAKKTTGKPRRQAAATDATTTNASHDHRQS